MFVTGSPEWFNKKSHTKEMDVINTLIENRREKFICRFFPERLSTMNGEELLQQVFSDDPDSMMRWLMFDKDYRWFGAAGQYKYLGIIYQDGHNWKYKEGVNPEVLTVKEAVNRAERIRDQLISCVSEIENTGLFATIRDYQDLQNRIEKVFFYKYPWALKYYQILYPQYFPGMYADKTIERALYILGLPNYGKANRLINAGVISMFIRKCDVNNIVFNCVYSDEWGWEEVASPCPNAAANHEISLNPVKTVNMNYYKAFDCKNREDYWSRYENAEAEHNKSRVQISKKNTSKKVSKTVEQRVRHKSFGEGTVIEIKNGFIIVNFQKTMNGLTTRLRGR